MRPVLFSVIIVLVSSATAGALDIPNGDYAKNDPAYIRVMTWNMYQHLGDPSEVDTAWTNSQIGSPLAAINLVVAALDPDILLLQEVGDIDHSTSYATALAALQSWRNTNRPGFALFMAGGTGGSIHNAIISRWPFGDLNGDGISTRVDIPYLNSGPGGYPQGGTGGIRGWSQCEINLPDGTYAGDIYVGCSHFKALSGYDAERQRAASNIAAYIQYALNSNDDPYNVIPDSYQPPSALNALTPVVLGGDFNSVDSWTHLSILQQNNASVSGDGTDRDGGPVWRSDSAAAFNGTTHTWGSSSHLDWMYVQDSIATVDAAFVFDTGRMPYDGSRTITQGAPPSMQGLSQNARISEIASDHRPVVVDLVMPNAVVFDHVSIVGVDQVAGGGYAQYQGVSHYSDGTQNIVTSLGTWEIVDGGGEFLSPGLLHAGVAAFDDTITISFSYTDENTTKASQKLINVTAQCDRSGDVNEDGRVDGGDIEPFVGAFLGWESDPQTICRANMVNDAAIDAADLSAFLDALLVQ